MIISYQDKLKRSFSRSARSYDSHALVQSEVAKDLINLAPTNGVSRIMEPGCGTGIYTCLLRDRFTCADIFAFDISESMIDAAKKKLELKDVNFAREDCENIVLSEGYYDFISSNACLHWLKDLDTVIARFERSLEEGGIMTFSLFGPKTFCELDAVLKSVLGSDMLVAAGNFMDKTAIELVLRKHFKTSSILEKDIKMNYSTLKDLLVNIKYTGTSGNKDSNLITWNKNLMKKVERAYFEMFGEIIVSYQVFFCKAIK